MESVYCAVGTGSLNKADLRFVFKRLNNSYQISKFHVTVSKRRVDQTKTGLPLLSPLNAELNPIRHLLSLVGARHIVHVSRVMVEHCICHLFSL